MTICSGHWIRSVGLGTEYDPCFMNARSAGNLSSISRQNQGATSAPEDLLARSLRWQRSAHLALQDGTVGQWVVPRRMAAGEKGRSEGIRAVCRMSVRR